MAQRTLEQRVENLEQRVGSIEQILPTLATKADFVELKTELKTELKAELSREWRADIEAAVAPLATTEEVRAEGERTRRYFDIVAEGLRGDIRLIAEGLATLQISTDAQHADVMAVLTQHDRRLARLEARDR